MQNRLSEHSFGEIYALLTGIQTCRICCICRILLVKKSKDDVLREKLERGSVQVVSFMAEHRLESRMVVLGIHSLTRLSATAAVGVQ